MKRLIKRIPLWIIFLVALFEVAAMIIPLALRGDILGSALCLVMTLELGISLGIELMSRKNQRIAQNTYNGQLREQR